MKNLAIALLLSSSAFAAPAGDPEMDFILTPPPGEAVALAGDDKDLSHIGEALQTAGLARLDQSDVRTVKNIPFASAAETSGLVADLKHPSVVISLNKPVQYVYVLFAVLDAGNEPLARLTILREDGVPTRINFVVGENAVPCIGPWQGKLEPKKGVPGKVMPVLETKARDGTPVRLLLLEWRNDNEWYNVSDLKFKLLAPATKTRLVVLGVTGANTKKQ